MRTGVISQPSLGPACGHTIELNFFALKSLFYGEIYICARQMIKTLIILLHSFRPGTVARPSTRLRGHFLRRVGDVSRDLMSAMSRRGGGGV